MKAFLQHTTMSSPHNFFDHIACLFYGNEVFQMCLLFFIYYMIFVNNFTISYIHMQKMAVKRYSNQSGYLNFVKTTGSSTVHRL